MTRSGEVTITLTSDEALVLFELLHRWEDGDCVRSPEHKGEQVALGRRRRPAVETHILSRILFVGVATHA